MKLQLPAMPLVLLSTVVAQDPTPSQTQLLSELPSCVLPCLISAIQASNCSPTNTTCICSDSTLQLNLTVCVQAACNATEVFQGSRISQQLCTGVPIQSRGQEIYLITIVLACITFPIVGLRVISRMKFSRRLYEDDYCALISAVVLLPLTIIEILSVNKGFGRHLWNIPPSNLSPLLEYFYLTECLYATPLGFAKISVLLLYLRIFVSPIFRRLAWATLLCVALSTATTTIVAIFQCWPIPAIWNLSRHKKCINMNVLSISTSTVNTALDVVMLLIPLPELRKLNLGWKKKIGVFVMFLTGTFATATSITRLIFVASFESSKDPTFDNTPTVVWSAFELNISLICACLPAIRPLLTHFFPRMFGTEVQGKPKPDRTPKVAHVYQVDKKSGKARHVEREEDELELTTYASSEDNWI